jgi:membrane protein required for colicin V production
LLLTHAVSGWNELDWLLGGIVALSVMRGFWRGFLQALFALAGVFCGFAVAAGEYHPAVEWVLAQHWTRSPEVTGIACYLALFVGVMMLFAIAGSIARRTAHAIGLGLADRLLGGLLGLVRGLLIGATVVGVMGVLAPSSSLLLHSRLSSYFLAAGHAVSFVLPHTLG